MKLITHRYLSRISVVNGTNVKIILDTENDTLFTVSNDFLYSFKDKNYNTWSTVPESFTINEQVLYPVLGTVYQRSDGIKHSFTTKEIVIAMATQYFEKFIDKDHGLEKEMNGYLLNYQGKSFAELNDFFKSKNNPEIEGFISNN
jgi:hypothetical protein